MIPALPQYVHVEIQKILKGKEISEKVLNYMQNNPAAKEYLINLLNEQIEINNQVIKGVQNLRKELL